MYIFNRLHFNSDGRIIYIYTKDNDISLILVDNYMCRHATLRSLLLKSVDFRISINRCYCLTNVKGLNTDVSYCKYVHLLAKTNHGPFCVCVIPGVS